MKRIWCWLIGHRHVSDERPYGGTCSRCGDRRTFIHDGSI